MLLSVALLFCAEDNRDTIPSEEIANPYAVEAVVVSRGIYHPYLEKSGVARGVKQVVVVSETEGVIRTVLYDYGDLVEKGGVIASVDREEARYAMLQAQQQLSAASLNYSASQRLFEDNTISREEYEKARSSYNGARSTYKAARERFRNTEITTPISGVVAVIEEEISVGNYISRGAVVAQIVDLSKIRIEAAVGEREIALVRAGADVAIYVPAVDPDRPFMGRVKAVAAGAMPGSGSYPVAVVFDNEQMQVRSGMSARVTIRTTDTDSVILLPSVALIRDNNTVSVFMVRENRVVKRGVTIGRALGNVSEVKSGISEEDTVIVSRTTTLEQGDTVIVRVIGKSGDWE